MKHTCRHIGILRVFMFFSFFFHFFLIVFVCFSFFFHLVRNPHTFGFSFFAFFCFLCFSIFPFFFIFWTLVGTFFWTVGLYGDAESGCTWSSTWEAAGWAISPAPCRLQNDGNAAEPLATESYCTSGMSDT